jgi:hypothetical protein
MYGFECRTDTNSELLISSEYANLHLLSDAINYLGTYKMPFPGTSWTPTWHKYSIYYPFDTPPLVFINLEVDESSVMGLMSRNGNNWEFLVIARTGTWNVNNNALSASTIQSKLRCFGKRVSFSSGGHGIKVFGADGSTNFSSRDNPLWLTTFSQFSNVSLSGAEQNQATGTMNGAHTLALFHTPIAAAQPFPFQTSYTLVGWKRTGATTFSSYRMLDTANVTLRSSFILIADLVT